MSNIQCFKIKKGSPYDKAVQMHFNLLNKWEKVFEKVSELLGENITKLAFLTNQLYVDNDEIIKLETKKYFTKEGKLKSNTKAAKEILRSYKEIIKSEGLCEFKELSLINFMFGVMRMRGQSLESFRTSKNDIYYKADFDLEFKSNGMVEPITQVEYGEKYLEELKKRG